MYDAVLDDYLGAILVLIASANPVRLSMQAIRTSFMPRAFRSVKTLSQKLALRFLIDTMPYQLFMAIFIDCQEHYRQLDFRYDQTILHLVVHCVKPQSVYIDSGGGFATPSPWGLCVQ
ncbi:hypothetical protein [Bacteroides thetaiotaomicron]|uniref:hypothetical protein n=1 Tax=Bacteroides thetaiotaomicron TaxID=818 RepID=UPI00403FC8C0